MAWVLALGNRGRIDAGFISAIFEFVFLGAYGIGKWAVLHDQSSSWGLGFLAIRATIVSVARMTPDAALAGLRCLGALSAEEASTWKTSGILVVAPFVRETGLLLNAAAANGEARAREYRRAGLFLALIPPFGGGDQED
jgi:hypothetical protein